MRNRKSSGQAREMELIECKIFPERRIKFFFAQREYSERKTVPQTPFGVKHFGDEISNSDEFELAYHGAPRRCAILGPRLFEIPQTYKLVAATPSRGNRE